MFYAELSILNWQNEQSRLQLHYINSKIQQNMLKSQKLLQKVLTKRGKGGKILTLRRESGTGYHRLRFEDTQKIFEKTQKTFEKGIDKEGEM